MGGPLIGAGTPVRVFVGSGCDGPAPHPCPPAYAAPSHPDPNHVEA